jgi:hypothetical protein
MVISMRFSKKSLLRSSGCPDRDIPAVERELLQHRGYFEDESPAPEGDEREAE